ncbi:MAG: hypothetical protein HamCj_21380 [Candidatus Hamiltonella defensa (Ceratovacuna japonica)]
MGGTGPELNAELAKRNEFKRSKKGASVTQVLRSLPPRKQSARVGDTVVKINDKPLNSFFELS